MTQVVRWEAKHVDAQTTRYSLRTRPRGRGKEIGTYESWDNARSEKASERIAAAIEQQAIDAGYALGDETWNDLIDY